MSVTTCTPSLCQRRFQAVKQEGWCSSETQMNWFDIMNKLSLERESLIREVNIREGLPYCIRHQTSHSPLAVSDLQPYTGTPVRYLRSPSRTFLPLPLGRVCRGPGHRRCLTWHPHGQSSSSRYLVECWSRHCETHTLKMKHIKSMCRYWNVCIL